MKILIVKIGSIGDVIMSLPLIDLINTQNKENQITWVVGEASFPILSKINIIRTVKINETNLIDRGFLSKVLEVFKTWKKIGFSKKFDLIICAHSDPKYKLLALPFLWSGHYRSFHSTPHAHSNLIPGRHHTSEYLRLFHQNDSLAFEDISFPEIDFGSDRIGWKRQDVTIAIAPGGAKTDFKDDKLRRWPIENYVQLASKLIQNNFKVVLIGGPSDIWTIDYFSDLAIECQIGKKGLMDSIFELKSMHCLVTHDCGPMHFAILAKIPVVGLFGPTNPYEKIPKSVSSHFIWGGEDLPCRPCYDGRYYSNCSSNICMQQIDNDIVYHAVLRILEKAD